ncbi:hypothetical protein PV08_10775 [Exophiala spinifera]|uniref:Uncharacterized protein n=1 Tax=Exophiala spinifera TaxID=91928 RepID=A0A0D2AYL2_9EURO|nr:uncharacterized protein PV08_10775 [Exophiala spinifera]KIW11475.1 hypothetical protein PV08_10775 [Exophiala spinifera]
MNFQSAVIWQVAAGQNVDPDEIRSNHTDPIASVTMRGRWDRVVEILMDKPGKDLEAMGWALTKHIKLALPADVRDNNEEDGWLGKEISVKDVSIAVRKHKNATISSGGHTRPVKTSKAVDPAPRAHG